MPDEPERFWYPFTATTVIARKLAPFLLFTLGVGLFLWAGREYDLWLRPWAVWPAAALGGLAWLAAGYFFTLLPEVRADGEGLWVRRWGLRWQRIPWEAVAGVDKTAEVDLLGWVESLYTVYRWRAVAGRRQVRVFRFSGHIRNCERLEALIQELANTNGPAAPGKDGSLSTDPRHTWKTPARRSWSPRLRQFPWVHTALFVSLLTVYSLTLVPGVLGGDVGELQFVPYILGLAHPTGTPLYCILGKLWTLLPLGPSVAWRMNLLSAIAASLAAVVVYHHVQWRTQRIVPSLAAVLSLALGVTFWEQATMADKYAFNALFVALILHLALRWGETRSPRTLNLLVFAYGLSLTHHRTMALFAPTLLGYIWWHERSALWRRGRRLLRLATLFLAPLLFYLYLPWAESRNLPPGTWHPQTLVEWYHYLMDTGQIGYLYIDPADVGERLQFYAQTLLHDFTWIGLLLGFGGFLWQYRRRRADAVFLLVSGVLHAFLAANHHLPRQWTFFIPSFIVFTLWLGEALGAVWRGMERIRPRWKPARFALAAILATAMLALPALPFPARYQSFREGHHGAAALDNWRQELKQGRMGERIGRAIANVALNAIIVGDWEQSTPLWYYQQVEGWRPDVEIIYPLDRLDEAAASGRPLYLARSQPGLWERWHPSSAGPLIALYPEPNSALPPGISPLNVQFGEVLELAGFAYGEAEFQPATVVPISLYWRAIQRPEQDYSVSLRLLDEGGRVVFKIDSEHPVSGTHPTSTWTQGEVVADYYEIQLAGDLPPGTYQWGVILYRVLPEGGWENLQVVGTDSEMAMGDRFEVQGR